MKRKGFTLIELMIVIAIIAILAAVGVPSILGATRVSNERNASSSLKGLNSIEMTFRSSDAEQNGVNDFWTSDVAGLYYLTPGAASGRLLLIEFSVAIADGNTNPNLAGATWTPLPQHKSSPKAGYWFQALLNYENPLDTAVAYSQSGISSGRNLDRYGFIAYPNAYGSSGRMCFVLNESGTMFKRDPASQPNYLSGGTTPVQGAADTDGILTPNAYDTFPSSPNGPGSTKSVGPWSKMD